MSEKYLIKKYANRRLYDTVASKHITLQGIHGLIRDGHDVQIIDDTSGEDITRALLLQIIAEQEQGGQPLLDSDFLARIIRLYGDPMQDVMRQFLLRSFDTFIAQQTQLQDQLRAAMKTTPLATMQDLMSTQLKNWVSLQETLLGTNLQSDKKDEDEQ